MGDMDVSDACIMQYLCSTYDGVVLETKTMKQYTWNEAITKHFQKRVSKRDGGELAEWGDYYVCSADLRLNICVFCPHLQSLVLS